MGRIIYFAALFMTSGVSIAAAQQLGVPAVSPLAVPLGTPTVVTISIDTSGHEVVSSSLNVQRLDAAGRAVAVLTSLNDAGISGDALAGDRVFSGRIVVNEPIDGSMGLRVSAAQPGRIMRLTSSTVRLEVAPANVPTRPKLPNLAAVEFDEELDIEIVDRQVLVGVSDATPFTVIQQAITRAGGTIVGRLPELGIVQMELSSSISARAALEALRQESSLLWSEPLTLVEGDRAPDDRLFRDQWSLDTIVAAEAWDITVGRPFAIGVIDSGVRHSHEDLATKVIAGIDFVDGDLDPSDVFGHGTAVSAIAAANTNNSLGIAGICWACSVISERVLNDQNKGTWVNIGLGVVDAVKLGAKVINLSLGGSAGSQTAKSAVKYAQDRGRVVVASAGNEANSELQYPAAYPGVISVGSTNSQNDRAAHSSYGTWVSLYAPGDHLWSAHIDGTYDRYIGTSFAAPHVAGTVALMASVNSTLTPKTVREILLQTADVVGFDPVGMPIRRLNVANAVERARTCSSGCNSSGPLVVAANTFGAGQSYTPHNGLTLAKQSDVPGDWEWAMAFAPSADVDLAEIALAVTLVEGANELDVWIADDANGTPGTILEAFHTSGSMGVFGTSAPPVVLTSDVRPRLVAGRRYWIAASLSVAGSWGSWNFDPSYPGNPGLHAFRLNGSPWRTETFTNGAFRVSGTPWSTEF